MLVLLLTLPADGVELQPLRKLAHGAVRHGKLRFVRKNAERTRSRSRSASRVGSEATTGQGTELLSQGELQRDLKICHLTPS